MAATKTGRRLIRERERLAREAFAAAKDLDRAQWQVAREAIAQAWVAIDQYVDSVIAGIGARSKW